MKFVYLMMFTFALGKLLIVTSLSPWLELVQDVKNSLILKPSQNGKERYRKNMYVLYVRILYTYIHEHMSGLYVP